MRKENSLEMSWIKNGFAIAKNQRGCIGLSIDLFPASNNPTDIKI
jgi:hypothetical protein